MIEVRGLSRRYGSVKALSNASLTVEKGSVLGLLGQNGAGKTTLLNIVTGYLAPTEGSVRVDGFAPLLQPAQAKRRLGYLPEHPPLYDEETDFLYLLQSYGDSDPHQVNDQPDYAGIYSHVHGTLVSPCYSLRECSDEKWTSDERFRRFSEDVPRTTPFGRWTRTVVNCLNRRMAGGRGSWPPTSRALPTAAQPCMNRNPSNKG